MVKHTSALVLVVAIAGCSQAPGLGTLPARPGAFSTQMRTQGDAPLVVRIRMAQRHGKAHYVSAATKGIGLTFGGSATFRKAVNVSPGSPLCSGSPRVCTVTMQVPAGAYRATIDAYDAAPVGGAIPAHAHLLSAAANVPVKVALGKKNKAGFTLDGVPASLTVAGLPNASAGTSFSAQTFTVAARDGAGDTIVGTYFNPVTLTDSDTTGATTLHTSGTDSPPAGELLGSSDTASIAYTGARIPFATITATAPGASASATMGVHLPVYVTDYSGPVGEIAVGCTSATCVTVVGAGFVHPRGVAVDAAGNAYVAVEAGSVWKVPPGCSASSCQSSLGGGFASPEVPAVDSAGNVFVSDANNQAVFEIPPGCQSFSCMHDILSGTFANPYGVALDASANLFVTDEVSEKVYEVFASCAYQCDVVLGGGFGEPSGVAVDPFGNVFVADDGTFAVYEMPVSCRSAACVTPIGGGFVQPTGVAVDGYDDVFVSDFGAGTVKEIPKGCASAACVSTIGGGFTQPINVGLL